MKKKCCLVEIEENTFDEITKIKGKTGQSKKFIIDHLLQLALKQKRKVEKCQT